MNLRIFSVPAAAFLLAPAPVPLLADSKTAFEGTVSAALTRNGTEPVQFLYTRKGNQLRVENLDKSKPDPINVVDLDAKKITIIYPHNSSFVRIDSAKAPVAPGGLPPGMPNPAEASVRPSTGARPVISPPPGFPTRPPMPVNPAGAVVPGVPQMPQMPQMPANPAGAGIPGGMPMPPMPQMPAFPRPGGEMSLQKTEETRNIHGFTCSRYTFGDRHETFTIWATPDSALFPFRLLQRNPSSRRFGPLMIEEEWMGLLQKQSLFPLEATLSTEAGNEQMTFKVTAVERKKVDDDGGKMFAPPDGYLETSPPPF